LYRHIFSYLFLFFNGEEVNALATDEMVRPIATPAVKAGKVGKVIPKGLSFTTTRVWLFCSSQIGTIGAGGLSGRMG